MTDGGRRSRADQLQGTLKAKSPYSPMPRLLLLVSLLLLLVTACVPADAEAPSDGSGGESTADEYLEDESIPLKTRDVLRRWLEAEEHWPHMDAFRESMEAVNADRVIGAAEFQELCFKRVQWRDQLEGAVEYIEEYRAVEPTLVAETPRLYKLEEDALLGLTVIMALESDCP